VQPRRLLLVRHAKAAGGAVDADRPLTHRGERQAAAIGPWLQQAGLLPDRVLVSPARRAVQTWAQVAGGLAAAPEKVVDPRIYDNTVEALLEALRELPDDALTVALVGHNPSVGELSLVLDDGEDSGRDDEAGFPTGAVAVFTLATSWHAVGPGTATLVDFHAPD